VGSSKPSALIRGHAQPTLRPDTRARQHYKTPRRKHASQETHLGKHASGNTLWAHPAANLDTDEREEYGRLIQKNERDLKKYEIKRTALKKMQRAIIETIDINYVSRTFNKDAVGMMAAIRDQFKPTDFTTKMEILNLFQQLMAKPPKRTDNNNTELDKWLTNVETLHDEGIRHKVPGINSNTAVIQFLLCTSSFAS
jgi:hypothetical protein